MSSVLEWACVAACLVQPLMASSAPTGRLLSEASGAACGSLNSPCCSGDGDYDSCPAGWDYGAPQTLTCSGQTCVLCGGAGEACCQQHSFSDPSCDDGYLCASRTCKACGREGLPCCVGDSDYQRCPGGTDDYDYDMVSLRCTGVQGNGTCEKCGAVAEACCQRGEFDTPSCADGNVCASGTCKACGLEGLPCCSGTLRSELCPVDYADEGDGLLHCDGVQGNGTCEKCGGVNEPCCRRYSNDPADASCDDGNTCASGTCKPCGGEGLPCCEEHYSSEDNAKLCPAGFEDYEVEAGSLVCSSTKGNGTCETCGGIGGPCCQRDSFYGPSCDAGGVCASGTCKACGGLGQQCCPSEDNHLIEMCSFAGHAMCLEGVCTACGRPGQPCCTGDGNGRITGVGTEAADFVCWSGAACPDSRTCPPEPVPAATEADKEFCTANFAEIEVAIPGQFFDACVGAAANTKCEDTVLAGPAGSRIVPDWCLDFSGNRSAPTFDCPAAAATGPPKYVYCSETNRTAECGNTFCQGGDVKCEAWSPRTVVATSLFALQPGIGGFTGSTPIGVPVIACDGSLQILTRPGIGNSLYSVAINGELQTTFVCIISCFNAPVEVNPVFGTTITWTANPGAPATEAGAISKASAVIFVSDTDGLQCIGPGLSHTATRTQYELTCLLLDSPDDMPTGPLFPDATGPSPPAVSPDAPVGGDDADADSPEPPAAAGGPDELAFAGGDADDGSTADAPVGGGAPEGSTPERGGSGVASGAQPPPPAGNGSLSDNPQAASAMPCGPQGAAAALLAAVIAMQLLS